MTMPSAYTGNCGRCEGLIDTSKGTKLIAEHMISLTGKTCTMRRTVQIARSRCR